jgi:hypothetical protein
MRRPTILMTLATVLLVISGSHVNAQLNMFWDEMGPNNVGNHVRAIAVSSNGTAWAGSVGGGLWRSANGGSTWEMVPGLSDNLAVSTIAIDGNNIYVGTGETFFYKPDVAWTVTNWTPDSVPSYKEGFLKFSSQPGEGVFASNDGGATWNHDNGTWNSSSVRYMGDFASIQKVAAGGGRVFVASLKGLYWSTDANLSTVTKSTGTSYFMSSVIVDVEIAAGGVVLAATMDSLYLSSDNGVTFGPAINSLLPVGSTAPNNRIGGDRIEIAVAPSNNSVIYVTGASNITGNCTGVWRSTDNATTWMSIAPYESATFKPLQNKGRYSLILAVPPFDPYSVIVGGTKMYKYTDASNWTEAASHSYIPGFSTRYVPVPQLAIAFDPSSDSTMYVGTDAEIVKSTNYGRTYSFKTKGFNNAHLYGVSAAANWKMLVSDRFGGVYYRDNSNASQSLLQYNDIFKGTGGGIARWSVTHPSYIVTASKTDRGLERSLTNGTSFETFYGLPIEPFHPSFGVNPDSMYIDRPNVTTGGSGVYDLAVAPIMPWCLDEYIPQANLAVDSLIQSTPIWLYLCTRNFVWVCTNPFGGIDSLPEWNRISEDLVNNNLPNGKKEFFTAITVSGDQDHTIYVGTNTGKIYRILRANDPLNLNVLTDVQRIDLGQNMPARWITDLEFDPGNRDNLIVTYGAFNPQDDRVYITNDAKAAVPTFRSIQGNLEAGLPVHSAAFHPDPNRKIILIGTEEGVYGTSTDYENSANTVVWNAENTNIGTVPVTDIGIRQYYMDWIDATHYKYANDYTVFIATHGRGAFKSTSLVSVAENSLSNSGSAVKIGPNPSTVSATITVDLSAASKLKLEAFGIDGRSAGLIADKFLAAGQYDFDFITKDLPAGIYLIKAEVSNGKGIFKETLRQVVVK